MSIVYVIVIPPAREETGPPTAPPVPFRARSGDVRRRIPNRRRRPRVGHPRKTGPRGGAQRSVCACGPRFFCWSSRNAAARNQIPAPSRGTSSQNRPRGRCPEERLRLRPALLLLELPERGGAKPNCNYQFCSPASTLVFAKRGRGDFPVISLSPRSARPLFYIQKLPINRRAVVTRTDSTSAEIAVPSSVPPTSDSEAVPAPI